MKKFIITLLFYSSFFAQTTATYTESTTTIANPERGFKKYSITDNNYYTNTNYSNLSAIDLASWRTGSDKVTVVFRYFLLSNFLTTDISPTYLANMQKDFDIIRTAGLKCIVRFSYSNAQGTTAQQPLKTKILSHISQLAPILNTNKDIIVSHQAGFIGTWGEWYYTNSTEFGTDGSITPLQWQNRKEIVDAMLTNTPVSIPIQVRYAQIKKTLYGTTALTAATAYGTTAASRIGFFNDAFLNDYGDQGTYEVSSQFQNPVGTADYVYISNETKYTPMSGETNGLNGSRTDGPNAVTELDATNWSLLNRDYFEQNIINWTASGHYDTMLKKLGYRFVLNNANYTTSSNNVMLQINLENKGYARPFKQRKVYVVFVNTTINAVTNFEITTDIRTWETSINLTPTINVSTLANGTYQLYLFMPDSENSITNRPEYAIQCANNNTWNSTTGYNNLQLSYTKTSLSTDDFVQNSVAVFPNPTKGIINVTFPREILKGTIKIFSIDGKLLEESNIENSKGNILNIEKYAKGIYWIKIFENGLEILSKKMIKE